MFPDDVKSPFLHHSTGAAVHRDQIDCISENTNLLKNELKNRVLENLRNDMKNVFM